MQGMADAESTRAGHEPVTRREFEEYKRHQRRVLDSIVDQVNRQFGLLWAAVKALQPAAGVATKVTLKIGANMAGSKISIDDATKKATLTFEDNHNDPADTPAGLTGVTWSVDDPTKASVANDPADPAAADITPLALGDVSLSASPTGTYDDGQPIGPASGTFSVIAGAATQDALEIQSS
jgi:hypothetical protein